MAKANEDIFYPIVDGKSYKISQTDGVAEPWTKPRTASGFSRVVDATVLVVMKSGRFSRFIAVLCGAAPGDDFVPNELGEEAERAEPGHVG